MLLSHKTSVKLNINYSNIIGHMCYAAYKLWNVCNYERFHYKELGLDTLIMGIRDGEAIREFFNLPENEQAVSVIAVGYGTKDAQMPKRKSVSDIAKFY